MDPITLSLLTQGAGGILSGILGGGKDRAERKRRRQIMQLSSPQHLGNLTNQLYSQFLSGPAMQQGQRSIYNATQGASNKLAGSLAARGLNTSGVGAIAPSLAGSAAAGQLGQLRTAGYNNAGQQAQNMATQQINTMNGFGGAPNAQNEAVGGSIGDISSLLLQLFGPQGSKVPKAKVRKAVDPGVGGTY